MTRLNRQSPEHSRGIVHIGPGAFFRAFVAPYTADAMAAAGGDWGITAVSLKSPRARDQLAPQGGTYTSVTLAPEGEKHRVIEAIGEVLVAPENTDAVIYLMADPAIHIVSLTITEKGYGFDAATGRLDRTHPDIAHDLQHPNTPCSAVGLIVAALEQRRMAGHQPFTVISCDNLPHNGSVIRAVVLDFVRTVNLPDLADWIAAEGAFPSCMVDRITPATTPEDLDRQEAKLGYRDEALVLHEPFRQWVIEDNFVGPRPAWEAAGAQFVRSVAAHEKMKLRCLNGTHSALAYLGYLAGHNTIAEAVVDPLFERLCLHLWHEEIVPTLEPPEGQDLLAYCAALLERYKNPAIQHRTWQIAMDGSQKLPQRILGTIADNLKAGRGIEGLALVVAGWMRYVEGVDEQGEEIDVRDPMLERLRDAMAMGPTEVELLEIDAIFPPSLSANVQFQRAVSRMYTSIRNVGVRATLKEML